MTPNPFPSDASSEHSKPQSGIANVFRSLGLRNRSSGYSIPASAPATTTTDTSPSSRHEYFGEVATQDGYQLLEKVKKDKPLEDRIVAAETLRTIVVDFPAQFVTDVWYNAQDLADNEHSLRARQAALKLFAACLKNITEPSSLDRLRFYRTIAQHEHTDDFDDQLHAMAVLTHGGRNLASFEREIGGLLSKWLRVLFVDAGKARQQRKREGGSPDYITGPEYCLKELFKFVTAIIKFNFQAFEEREINQILSDILSICRKTTHKRDIEGSIVFVETLVTYGYIPPDSLRPCIEVLCGTYATIRDLADATWNAISNLCRSHMAHKCIFTFVDILRTAGKRIAQVPNTNTLRGAVWFLEKLILENGKNGLPKPQLSIILPVLRDCLAADSARLELEVVRAVGEILTRPDLVSQISFDEWIVPLDILVRGSRRTTERHDGILLKRLGVPNVPKARSQDKDINSAIAQSLFQTINILEEACREPDFGHVEEAVEFFLQVFGHIPDSAAELVINYYATEHLCYPSCQDWLENSRRLIDVFFRTRTRPTEMRIQVLSMIKDVYETIREVCEEPMLYGIVEAALADFQSETDPKVLDALMKIIVDVAADSNLEIYHRLVTIITEYAHRGPQTTGRGTLAVLRPTSSYGSLVNIVTRGLTKLFMRNMNEDPAKAVRAYEELVRIAGSNECETDARLTSMKLLFRMRADSENAIFLVENPECDYLAGVLNRKINGGFDRESLMNMPTPKEDDSSSSRSHRSNSITNQSTLRHSGSRNLGEKPERRHRRQWIYPDPRPLPQTPEYASSPVLMTFYDPQNEFPSRQGPTLDPTTAIRMSLWMEQIIPIIQQGSEWEIYSFVLCHTPSQLANKTCFRNCKGHITMLRSYVCDQLHTNRMPNPDLPTDIKRADIAVSLVHLLTVLISYREHFAKNEKEGIVKAFQLGLHSWNRTAKPCIHALSICCYELPQTTSKYLSGILTKLSQIITSPVVSVHILEFLSALAKLPNLYSNFTEPDFKNIFGIAFRYIQHAKETAAQQSQRSSHHVRAQSREGESSVNDQPDLPQYVLTLAYNVLTTWFLSLKLNDRKKYVSWIIRGLVLHDHSNNIDEQSEACMDMLERFSYSENEPKPPQKVELPPGTLTKTWLNGNTIMTIDTTPDTGISRITVRRPAGTSSFSVKPEARDLKSQLEARYITVDDRPEGSMEDTMFPNVLPSHLMLLLLGGTGNMASLKPFPLTADDKTKRAIEVFDRIPVVDFHKIGVVYVGAGQTHETEILANAMGSPDYTEFISNLGDLVKLKGADINTGGLDRENDIDGPFMYMWKDRTTQIAFHITTMMPNSEHDPLFTAKKRHIGNDFVNIVFNNSGLPWKFGTIPSQFNFVSILISPEARSSFVSSRMVARAGEDKTFYRVKLACKEGFSDISPAQEPKMVSAKNLSSFVRNLALNASIYSHVFNEQGQEHITNPRHRLRSIKQMRERVGAPVATPNAPKPTSPLVPQSSNRRVSAMSTQTASTDHSLRSINTQTNGENENVYTPEAAFEDLLAMLDYTRWT